MSEGLEFSGFSAREMAAQSAVLLPGRGDFSGRVTKCIWASNCRKPMMPSVRESSVNMDSLGVRSPYKRCSLSGYLHTYRFASRRN